MEMDDDNDDLVVRLRNLTQNSTKPENQRNNNIHTIIAN